MAEQIGAGRFRNPWEQGLPDTLRAFAGALSQLGSASDPQIHQMAVPWGPMGNMSLRAKPPLSPQHEATLQDIKNAMSRLLRGNMPPKAADPRMVRQFENPNSGIVPPRGLIQSSTPWGQVPLPVKSDPLDVSLMPGVGMKSEAWLAPGQRYDQLRVVLDQLARMGLWP